MKITVTYEISDEQEKRLEALLPYCRRVEAFNNWTVEDVLQLIMEHGSTHDINAKLDFVEKSLPGTNAETPAGTNCQGIKNYNHNFTPSV